MKRFRLVFALTLLLTLLISSIAHANAGNPDTGDAPSTLTSFSINPSTAYYGDQVTFTVGYRIGATAANQATWDNVICFYYQDAGWNSLWPAVATSARGEPHDLIYAGAEGGAGTECDDLGFGGQVAEYYENGFGTAARLFGDTLTIQFNLPAVSPPATGSHNFDMTQEEGNACYGGCSPVDGASASITVASSPTDVYVSNTAGCGGNSPCYTGNSALQSAFDAVTNGGTVSVFGTWSQGGSNLAQLTGSKSVTLTGFNTPRIENGGGTCSGAMIDNTGSGTLTVTTLTINGTCGSGLRTTGILNSGSGTTNIQGVTVQAFTGSGNAGAVVSSGTLVIEGSTFSNNQTAMKQNGGTLYAFANNITSNVGSSAAVYTAGASYNLKCNYWNSFAIDATYSVSYAKRLGAPVVSYVEGTGLTLGAASLADPTSGSQVLVNLGRNTVNPPFNNGTVVGIGALASDFFGACLSRDGSGPGAITIESDNQVPGATGFRLYEITDATQCSPSDNTFCWDYQNVSCNTAACSVTDPTPTEGDFVVGNELDPTAVQLVNLTANPTRDIWLPALLALGALLLIGGAALILRKQQAA